MNEAAAEQQEAEIEVEEKAEVETHDGFVSLADNQAQVNKQHRKYRDAERDAARAATEREALQKELDDLKAASVDLSVPDVPDPYSETFQADIAERDAAIQRKTEHEAQLKTADAAKQRTEEANLKIDEEKLREKIAGFDKRMNEHGLNPVEVKQAAETIIDYGASESMQDILLEDVDGPLMVAYLAKNPLEIENLNGMSTLALVNHLNTEIRPKASLLKPKTSDAPDPPMILSGGGAAELEDPLLKGAKFS